MTTTKPIIRVTQLEQFRRLMSGEYPWLTERSVIDSITGEFVGNTLTRIGTAFHEIIQNGNKFDAEVPPQDAEWYNAGRKMSQEPKPFGYKYKIDDYDVIFDVPQVDTALAYRNECPGAFHEVRLSKDYGDTIVTGCADIVNGNEIRDIKTKFSPVNCNDYINSAQWRFYLEIFELDDFKFDLFVFNGYKEEKYGYDVRGLSITRVTPPITCYRYKDMIKDNRLLLSQFLDWAKSRNITKYLNINGEL